MSNAVLFNLYNRTEAQHLLTMQALASIQSQDIPTDIFVLDNGSTYPQTTEWVHELDSRHKLLLHIANESPIKLGNLYLRHLFACGYEHVLCVPNDIFALPDLYRRLLEFPHDIVAAHMNEHDNPPPQVDVVRRLHGDIHMALPLIRKSAYDKLVAQNGYFINPQYFIYGSDCSLKMRIPDAGVTTAQTNLEVWHYSGATHRLAPEFENNLGKTATADANYFALFEREFGFGIGSPEYARQIARLG